MLCLCITFQEIIESDPSKRWTLDEVKEYCHKRCEEAGFNTDARIRCAPNFYVKAFVYRQDARDRLCFASAN